MASAIPHHAIRDAEDRSWTVRLVAAVGDPVTAPDERRAAVQTLGALEDFRAIPCLTSVLENTTLDEPTRRAASEALANSDDSTTTAARRDWWASGDGVLMRHALVASGNTDRRLNPETNPSRRSVASASDWQAAVDCSAIAALLWVT